MLIARQPWLDADLSPEEERQLWNFGQGRPYKSEPEAYYAIKLVRELMERVDQVAVEVAEAEERAGAGPAGPCALDPRPLLRLPAPHAPRRALRGSGHRTSSLPSSSRLSRTECPAPGGGRRSS